MKARHEFFEARRGSLFEAAFLKVRPWMAVVDWRNAMTLVLARC
jgi:hypothetical protein